MSTPDPTTDRKPDKPYYHLPKAEVLGVPLAVASYAEVVDWMVEAGSAGRRETVSAAAVNLVMSAREDREVAAAVSSLSLIVPDGQPLVWALKLLGERRASRIYGPELMLRFLARAAELGIPNFLYGGRSEAALDLLADRLAARFPGLRICGRYWPPFRPLSADEERQVAAQIDASGAAVVWVGIGQPKQEVWMARMRPRLAAPLLCGVGAAFDFHAGVVRQAPPLLGDHGL